MYATFSARPATRLRSIRSCAALYWRGIVIIGGLTLWSAVLSAGIFLFSDFVAQQSPADRRRAAPHKRSSDLRIGTRGGQIVNRRRSSLPTLRGTKPPTHRSTRLRPPL